MKQSRESKSLPGKLGGYLVVWSEQSLDSDSICIYGDPKELKSLGEALIAMASIDQKKLSDTECPPEESHHAHYRTFCGVDEDYAGNRRVLTIGRVDEKGSGKLRDCFPPAKMK
jgi:hypothetical protein